ncbi:hypothetical protein CCAX7_60020 [Capsulimonas corticalis]|uniref:Uncharacterized protein n=1 Tax=Capsulimonas corticalis TaxID=2219043 RepID=A0A402CZK3_9BACT|nr:ATP-binding protein [Capsulimonas corticalis]BDI33951.1 hypothetical protein CCAX7_60020 [Capsulimonas corticalis]
MQNIQTKTATHRTLHDEFTTFIETPTKENLQVILRKNLGETNQIDFKSEWIDWPKLAQHVLAIANTQGGMIIVGVDQIKDTGEVIPKGIPKLHDPVDVDHGLRKYIPHQLHFNVENFTYTEEAYPKIGDKLFQVIFIPDRARYAPFIPNKESGDDIRLQIYVRRGTASVIANYDELQTILNRRIETEYSSQKEFNLEQEMAELRALYAHIKPTFYLSYADQHWIDMQDTKDDEFGTSYDNTYYPEESIDEFVAAAIQAKKARIRQLLRVST